MKLFFFSLLAVFMMVLFLTSVATASHYENTFAQTNWKEAFEYSMSSTSPVTCYYRPGTWLAVTPATAWTKLSLASDASGTAYAALWKPDAQYVSSYDNTFSNGYIHSGFAEISGERYGAKAQFYAYRQHGSIIDDWQFTFTT